MRVRARRLAAALAVLFVVATSGLLAGASAAGAATPIVVGSCATTVKGAPGTPIQLQPSAVLQPVVNVVRGLDPLNLITPTVRAALAKMPPIPIGTIPTGNGFITPGQIANAVMGELNKIPVLGPILGAVAAGVQDAFAKMCGVTVQGVNTAAAPIQDGTAKAADAANQAARGLMPGGLPVPGQPGTQPGGKPGTQPGPGTGGGPGGTGGGVVTGPNSPPVGGWTAGPLPALSDFGRSPMTDYSSVPFAQAGLYAPSPGVRYGGGVPGYSPQFGILGTDTPPADGVQAAGHAEALGGFSGRDIDLSVLLAVLVLSGVTAALVRTWVLRKTAA
jgi:hypothetical protein